MPELEPITREETLLDGGDLTPITRKEMFIKRIYDKNQSVPEPITREEYFLKKAGEGSGDVTIEQLNVTENGTYSESGKAYSPVVVNVPTPPIPENAYLLNNLSGLPADIASFSDGTDLPMASLKVSVTPYQDLHGYDGPWAGGAGKNKIPFPYTIGSERTINGVTATVSSDGTVTMNGTATEQAEFPLIAEFYNLPAGTYTLSGMPSGGGASTFIYNCYGMDESNTIIFDFRATEKTFLAERPIKRLYLYIRIISGYTANNLTIKPQIELGSTATTFAPYSNICPIIGWDEAVVTVADDAESPTTSHEYTIDLDGTRYGGVLDATNGTMTVDRVIADLSNVTATYNSGWNCWTIQPSVLPNAKIIDNNNTPTTAMTDRFKAVKASGYTTAHESGTIAQNTSGIWFIDNGSTTELSGQLVYELATPITVQLAPQPVKSLEGTNKIYANCGQITEVKYFKKA